MSRRFRFKERELEAEAFGINVIPMIDLVTILNAFLLISASFFAFGQIQVEIPFLSSKLPPKTTPKNQPRVNVNVTLDKNKIVLELQGKKGPHQDKSYSFPFQGDDDLTGALNDFHNQLVKIKLNHPRLVMFTLFPDEDTDFQTIIKVLDSARDIKKHDPPLTTKKPNGTELPAAVLFGSVVMGGVIL